jgi:uncharacterized membrane protein
MKRSTNPKNFFTPEESKQIEEAIAASEKLTSAEMKLVIVRHCWGDIKEKAISIFKKMDLDKTEERNCAMIMLVLSNREFLIYGDEGIHEKVGQSFWDDVRNIMLQNFKDNKFGDGIAEGIKRIGEKLKKFFPYKDDDVNEISNEVAYED